MRLPTCKVESELLGLITVFNVVGKVRCRQINEENQTKLHMLSLTIGINSG